MIFTPPKATGLAIGLGGFIVLIGLDVILLAVISSTPPSLLTFALVCVVLASLPALGWLGVRCVNLIRARYILSRNALLVDWGTRREVVPLATVKAIRPGSAFAADLRPRGITWPGYVAGSASFEQPGEVEFLATTPAAGLILIEYPEGWLALSPSDPVRFMQTFEQLRAQGPEDAVEPVSLTLTVFAWPLWQDRLALVLIALGGLGPLILVGYLSAIFSQLPAEIALHFGPSGAADRFGPATGLFILPLIAALAWVFNTSLGTWLHLSDSERPSAYLLLGGTVFVAALVWAATLSILTAG